jgi:hypothetical protein
MTGSFRVPGQAETGDEKHDTPGSVSLQEAREDVCKVVTFVISWDFEGRLLTGKNG